MSVIGTVCRISTFVCEITIGLQIFVFGIFPVPRFSETNTGGEGGKMALLSRISSSAKRSLFDLRPASAWCATRGLSDITKAFDDIPTTIKGGAAFENDLKSVSGLGVGDGIKTHTEKWLQGDRKSPMQYVSEVEPKKVKGLVVACQGSDHPSLGAPVSYLDLRGSSLEKPVTCKYTGYKYYSDDWKEGGAH